MIRVGIVGCGRILNAHLQGYKKLREAGVDTFRITALVARKEEDARMFVRRGEGPPPRPPVCPPESGDPLAAPHTYLSDFQEDVEVGIYTDYRQMIEENVVDAVNDWTTLALHHQIADVAFAHGKHLLTQKPLAISVAAARKMVATAEARGLTFGVFEAVRQARGTRATAWAVQKGLIGEPQMAVTGSLGGLWSPDKVVADTPWRHDKLLGGGGGSIDIGVHMFHRLRTILGEVEWVSGVARIFEKTRYRRSADGQIVETIHPTVDDTFWAVAGFANEAVAQLLWSWAGRGPALTIPNTPVFYGSQGCIYGDQLIDDKGNHTALMEYFEQHITPDERERFFPFGLTDVFALNQLDWLRAIEQKTDPETSGLEGLYDLACSFGVLESSILQRQVLLSEVLSGDVSEYQDEIDAHYGLL